MDVIKIVLFALIGAIVGSMAIFTLNLTWITSPEAPAFAMMGALAGTATCATMSLFIRDR